MDTLSAVVPFGDHVHLHLSSTDAVALTDHITEGTIATIAGVGRDEEVTEVDGLRDVTTDEVHGTNEVAHLRDSIRYQHGLEVISLIHPVADTSSDSIDILQYRCVLDTDNVTADRAESFEKHKNTLGLDLQTFYIRAYIRIVPGQKYEEDGSRLYKMEVDYLGLDAYEYPHCAYYHIGSGKAE